MLAAELAVRYLLDRAAIDHTYADRYPTEIAYDFVRELPRLPADASGLEGAVVTAGDTTPRGEVLFRICKISEGLASIRSIGHRASCYSTVKPVGRPLPKPSYTEMRNLALGDYLCPDWLAAPGEEHLIMTITPAYYYLAGGEKVRRDTAYLCYRRWTPEIGEDERRAREEQARTWALKEQRRIAEDVLWQISRRLNWWRSEGGLDKTTRRLQEILDSMPIDDGDGLV
jgi:hypothetical protein